MKLLGVYGASGMGREVLPLVRTQHAAPLSAGTARLVFIDDRMAGERVNGHEVVAFDDFIRLDAEARAVSVAIADAGVRTRLADQCETAGVSFLSVRADNVVELDANEIGAGSILCPFVTITSNAKIGRHFHGNIYSYIAHDCVIGDFVTFAPGVCCNGNVVIEDGAYIGTNAVLKQGGPGDPLVIGRGAVVGMGAVVTRSVEAGAVVVGNPARPMQRK